MYWTVPLIRGPFQISPHACDYAAVPAGNKVYYFGGFYHGKTYDKDQIDVHVFSTVSLRWVKLTPVTHGRGKRPAKVAPMSCGHTAVLIQDIIYIWGGMVNCEIKDQDGKSFCTNGDDNDILYAFDVDTHRWLKPIIISGTVPEARSGHSACVLGKVMYIYGGWAHSPLDDMYKLDTSTMLWSLINTGSISTLQLYFHSATIIGKKMFLFGGAGTTHPEWFHSNNISVFDTETDCWLITPPAAQLGSTQVSRCGHSAFAYNGELYIFGGCGRDLDSNNLLVDSYIKDLWKLDSKTFSWKKVEPKGKGSSWSSLTWCCLVGDRIIVFGGFTTDEQPVLEILDLSPCLKTICKLAVVQYGLEQLGLPPNVKWELAGVTGTKERKTRKRKRPEGNVFTK